MSREKEGNTASLDDTENYASDRTQDRDIEKLLDRVNRLEVALDSERLDRSREGQRFRFGNAPFEQNEPQSCGTIPTPHPANLGTTTTRYNSPYQANKDYFGPASGAEYGTAEDLGLDQIQEQFNGIRASVDKVILPPYLKLHDSRSGVKRDDQQALNVISKCGRYTETALKILSQVKDDESFDVKPLITTLTANINYLQEEYATLLVKGRFDDQTAQLFRSLQKGNSGFDSRSINNVRIAAELSSIPRGYSRPQHFGNRPQGRGYNPRGGFGGYSGPPRGYYNDRRGDVYGQLQGSRFRNPRFQPPNYGDQ